MCALRPATLPGIYVMLMCKARNDGFSLVELMVAMVLGLIVGGAVITFIAATLQVNAETLQSTRLNQELRTLSQVLIREIRRARFAQDPIADIGSGCSSSGTCSVAAVSNIDTATAGCIVFGYQGSSFGDHRVIRLVESGGKGGILFSRAATPLDCDATGTVISSAVIDITQLSFKSCTRDVSGVPVAVDGCIEIELAGRLAEGSNDAIKHFRTTTSVRSGV